MDTHSKQNNVKTASGINIIAGAWLIAAPFVLNFANATDALWNHIIVGLVVVVLAAIRVSQPMDNAWMSWVNVALGVWMIIVPFLMRFGETAFWNSLIVGIIIAAMGAWSASVAQSGGHTRPGV